MNASSTHTEHISFRKVDVHGGGETRMYLLGYCHAINYEWVQTESIIRQIHPVVLSELYCQ